MSVGRLVIFVILALSVVKAEDPQDRELIEGIKALQCPLPDVSHILEQCEETDVVKRYYLDRSEVKASSDEWTSIRYLKEQQRFQFSKPLEELKFGKRALSMKNDHILDWQKSGSYRRVFVGTRNGNDIDGVIAVGTKSCNVKKLYSEHKTQVCRSSPSSTKCEWRKTYVQRGLTPEELSTIINYLDCSASKFLLKAVSAATGLRSVSPDFNLHKEFSLGAGFESNFYRESSALRGLYPELEFEFNQLNEVENNDIAGAIRDYSKAFREITDGHDLNIMANSLKEYVYNQPKRSCLYAPDDTYMYHIYSIKKGNNSNDLRFVWYKIDTKMPSGSLACDNGHGWHIHKHGAVREHNFQRFTQLLPPFAFL